MDVPDDRAEAVREYYLQDAVVEAMVEAATYREVAPTYPWGYGSRPDAVNFPGDLRAFVEDGAIAFHGSVERWRNPLLIDEVEADDLRTGWDLVIDIDCDADLHYAKLTAAAVVEALHDHGVDHVSVKFSGNRGFHVGVRGEAFPAMLEGTPLSDWYPELPQAVVSYLRDELKADLAAAFTEYDPGVRDEVYEDGEPTPYRLCDIENDWGDRHLFRMPYSVNEKSWLVSLPLEPTREAIMGFEKPDAAMDAVTVDAGFLEGHEEGEAAELAVDALDWWDRTHDEDEASFDGEFTVPDEAIPEEDFPPTIKNILQGLEDGRKRSLFILITFLQHCGYDWDSVKARIWEWNERNDPPLDETYVETQLNWHERQDEPLMPPNWDAKGFYEDLGVYEEDALTEAVKNPVAYAFATQRDDEDDADDDGEKDPEYCPYCGKEYQGETKWYRDHVMECQG